MNRIILLVLVTSGVLGTTRAQIPNIKFFQGDTVSLKEGKKDYYEINLKKEPFIIFFEGNELHVCASLEEELFQFTKAETDINSDFSSYFFIFKYLAGSPDSDFLSIEKDTGNSLNETHGARPARGSLYQYTVRNIMNEGNLEPISEFKRLFMALWLDDNKDQFIDKQELMWVKASLK